MLSKRPYLIPAFYQWIVDQNHVPHLVVDATVDQVQVPEAFVQDGRIQLNISPNAVRDFFMTKAAIQFEARFGGRPEQLYVPMRAIIAIVDRDSGQGASFVDEVDVVFPDDDLDEGADKPETSPRAGLHAVSGKGKAGNKTSKSKKDDDDEPPPSGPGGGPNLRVVK